MRLGLPRLRDIYGRIVGPRSRRSKREASRHRTHVPPKPTPFSEEFRLLALNVMTLLEDSPNKMVTVFSAEAGEGRSIVAQNLSLALAEHNDVLLADPVAANLRKLLPSDRVAGMLPPDLTRSAAFQRKVWLLPSNRPLVGEAGQLAPHLKEAHSHGMFVVVDAPAAAVSSQSFLLAQKTGNVIYVMPNRRQDVDRHQRLLDHLKRLRVRVLGIVLNDG